MKLLLIGPAHGHNIEPFLDYFNKDNKCFTEIAYSGKNEFSTKYKNIKFLEIQKKIPSLISLTKSIRKADFIWIHGGYDIKIITLIVFLKKTKTKINLNFWGEVVPRRITTKSFYSFIYKLLIKRIDFLQCNWYGTYNILEKDFRNKLNMFPWGMEKSFFSQQTKEVSLEAKEFVNKISKYKVKFFFPKSTSIYAKHDLVIEAAHLYNQKNINKDYVIIFWLGNSNDEVLISKYESSIEKYKLKDNIIIQRHSFLNFSDIKFIWENVDCGINFVTIDQLSTSILEPMLMKKELIISDIDAYRLFNTKYDLNLNLTANNNEAICKKLKLFIDGSNIDNSVLNHRKKTIEKEFDFDKNIEKIMEFYSAKISS